MVQSRATKAQARVKKRTNRQAKVQLALASGWRMIDKKKETFLLPALPESLERATLKFRGEAVTRFRIFDRILTPALLR